MKRLRVALLADYLEEGWPSMDLVAEMLLDRLSREHAAAIEVTLIRPLLRRRLSRVSTQKLAFGVDRITGRLWDYPRFVTRLRERFDLFHVVDHSYAQLVLPQVAEAFTHLGFPDYFRVELSWAKLLGVMLLLAPVPARLKEWVYAGFAINLVSAVIAHLSVGDGPEKWGYAAATGVLWALSYLLWRRV